MKEMNIYESLFKHNTDLFFNVNENGIIMGVNPAVRGVTCYSIAELMNKPFESLFTY